MQKLVEKGASKEKIGLRGPMPPGVLFAVYNSKTGNPDYIPPEYCDIQGLLDELIEYVNTTDDHPLIVAAVVHYQLVTIHPFEDGNKRASVIFANHYLISHGQGFLVIPEEHVPEFKRKLVDFYEGENIEVISDFIIA